MRWAAAAVGLLSVGVAFVTSCRTPTQIGLALSTDVKCPDLRGTSVTVGKLGEIEARASTTSSTECNLSGDLGTLIVVPSGGKSDEVAFRIIAGVGRDAETCVPPYGKGCIVARRAIHFVPNADLRISIPLRAACDGVACSEIETCVNGACTSAQIADPGRCSGPDGCGEESLAVASAGDGGIDAGTDAAETGPGGLVFNDITNRAFWSTFDLATVDARTGGFTGATFDGRYIYFPPYAYPGTSGVVTRYDTQAAFDVKASWSTFDTTTVNAELGGYRGAVFDKRYVYFVPHLSATPTYKGVVGRYDSKGAFDSAASWSACNLSTAFAQSKGFYGSVFDGRYLYFVPEFGPGYHGNTFRYDTQAPFVPNATSWSVFNLATVNANATGMRGGVFDGRYVYYVPQLNGGTLSVLARYDTQAGFASAASWTMLDLSTVGAPPRGFLGAAFDGRYLYLAPHWSSAFLGTIARYDTSAPLAAAASWSTFDATTVNPLAKGFAGTAFDGRFLYFVPNDNGAGSGAIVTRYDTLAPFGAATSWSTFDATTLNPNARGFVGAVFDGRFVYLVPGTYGTAAIVVRFDAKTPASIPPGYAGSFL